MACPANPYLGNPPRAMEFADSTQYRFWAEIIVVAFPFCWMAILVLWSLKYHLFRHCCHFKILNCGFIWVLEFPKPSQNLSMPKKKSNSYHLARTVISWRFSLGEGKFQRHFGACFGWKVLETSPSFLYPTYHHESLCTCRFSLHYPSPSAMVRDFENDRDLDSTLFSDGYLAHQQKIEHMYL